MLAIGVHFLTGRYAACRYNDRQAVEWPPEFARFYSALVDGWAAAGEDPAEAAALDWLAGLGPPAIWASEIGIRRARKHYVPVNDTILVGSHLDQFKLHVLWWTRRLTRAFLAGEPAEVLADLAQRALADVGDGGGAEGASLRAFAAELCALPHGAATPRLARTARSLAGRSEKRLQARLEGLRGKARRAPGKGDSPGLLPERRSRQERTFPVALPEDARVYFVWPEGEGATAGREPPSRGLPLHRGALERLLGRVARLGHSSSLVTCWLAEDPPSPNWRPDPEGGHVLRVVGQDQRARLEHAFGLHRAVEPRILPARPIRYRRAEERSATELPRPLLSGGWFVFAREAGQPLPLTRTADVAAALREEILRFAPQPVPELLSGVAPDGGPSSRPHAAFLALPFVGRPHATGLIMGLAVVLPGGLSEDESEPLLAAIGRWARSSGGARLQIGRLAWTLRYEPGLPEHWALQEARWLGLPWRGLRAARRWCSVTPVALSRNPGNLRSRDPARAAAAWRAAEEAIRRDIERSGLPEPLLVSADFQPLVEGSRPAPEFGPFPRRTAPGRFRRVLVHAEILFAQPVQGPLLLGAGRYFGLGLFAPQPAGEGDGP
jgi:CRISPR-associated protein Csb2